MLTEDSKLSAQSAVDQSELRYVIDYAWFPDDHVHIMYINYSTFNFNIIIGLTSLDHTVKMGLVPTVCTCAT